LPQRKARRRACPAKRFGYAAISFKQKNLIDKAHIYLGKALYLGNGEAAFELTLLNSGDDHLLKKYLKLCVNHESISEFTRQKARDMLDGNNSIKNPFFNP
jgi:hypothetical protein